MSYVSESNWFDLYVKFAQKNSSNLTTVTDEGKDYVRPSQFYAGLSEWDADIGSALDVLSSQVSSFGYAETGISSGLSWKDKGRLRLSKIAFTVDGLNSTKAYADMIKSVRRVCEKASKVSDYETKCILSILQVCVQVYPFFLRNNPTLHTSDATQLTRTQTPIPKRK